MSLSSATADIPFPAPTPLHLLDMSASTNLPVTKSQTEISSVLSLAISEKHISDSNPCAVFYDLSHVRSNVSSLIAAFPSDTSHAFAVKAAPLPALLRHLRMAGMGGECASIGELALCKAAGMAHGELVYDSPAKTREHLKWALNEGVHLNADCIDEVEMIGQVRKELGVEGGVMGLRVNPQMEAGGHIAETFTAGKANKFGEGMLERREEIVECFLKYGFLNAVHVHVGSQGCETGVIVEAIKRVVELVEEINERGGGVEVLDIGGGLSVEYWRDQGGGRFSDLAETLSEKVAGLWKYKLVTEFGRRLVANTGFIAAKVQGVKRCGGKVYVVCHVGADCLMRSVYHREKWGHRVEIYDKRGVLKVGREEIVDVAGPLCFSGDIVAVDVRVVLPEAGDLLVVRDAGAYTLGMYSRHTSQLVPAVYGYDDEMPGSLEILKKQESVDDLVKFWDV